MTSSKLTKVWSSFEKASCIWEFMLKMWDTKMMWNTKMMMRWKNAKRIFLQARSFVSIEVSDCLIRVSELVYFSFNFFWWEVLLYSKRGVELIEEGCWVNRREVLN
jgi:hypothetical protein